MNRELIEKQDKYTVVPRSILIIGNLKEISNDETKLTCFELFRKYKKHISSVTFWNISDRSSWLDNFPVPGRKDYPLLFDKELKQKKAYLEVVRF